MLCIIDIYRKYASIALHKIKKGITIINEFQKNSNASVRKSCKIWVDQGSEFRNRSMKSWLHDNDIKIYSPQNDRKPVVVERFIWILKSKIYNHMTAVSKMSTSIRQMI